MIQPVNLELLHAEIRGQLATRFPSATVAFYSRPGDKIATPGILLELEDMPVQEPGDIGTDQLPVYLNFNAYAVLDYKAGSKQAVRLFAAEIMAFVKGQRWDREVTGAQVVGAFPDVIQGKEDAYEVMRVEFQHEALLGQDVWRLDQFDNEGNLRPLATTVYSADAMPEGSELGEPAQLYPCDCQAP
jgi:hypothetical protein